MDVGRSSLWFLGAWVGGSLAGGVALALFDDGDSATDATIGALAASLIVLWAVELAACVAASRREGSGDLAADLGLSARPVDLLGLPIGVIGQLALVPAVYVPLRAVWPDTFRRDRLEETARDLVDRADGGLIVVLFALVVIGAPFVEEVLYRGLLQRPALGRYPAWAVVPLVALVFAVIHFRPVEYPGLFVAGLVFGVCAWRTGRLGTAICAHVGFNATGLLLVV